MTCPKRFALFCMLLPLMPALATAEPAASDKPAVADSIQRYEIPTDSQSANIFAYPRDYLAVQLLAVSSKQSVLDFISRNDLGDPPYGAMRSKGRILYVLLLGVYPDRAAAEAAIAAMPQTRPPVKPWIRKVGQLQDAVRAVNTAPDAQVAAPPD